MKQDSDPCDDQTILGLCQLSGGSSARLTYPPLPPENPPILIPPVYHTRRPLPKILLQGLVAITIVGGGGAWIRTSIQPATPHFYRSAGLPYDPAVGGVKGGLASGGGSLGNRAHTVVVGETLLGIAQREDCTLAALLGYNDIRAKDLVIEGRLLRIPVPDWTPPPWAESLARTWNVTP